MEHLEGQTPGLNWEDAMEPLRDVSALAVGLVILYVPRLLDASSRFSGGDHRLRHPQCTLDAT